MPEPNDAGRPPDSPFYCFAVGIAPGIGAARVARARLEELRQRNRWLAGLRWLAVAGLAAATLVAASALRLTVPAAALYATAAALAAYNAALLVIMRGAPSGSPERQLRRETALATFQIAADLVILTVTLHFAGGIENPFFLYFIFHMIIASILLSRRASFHIATFAVALFVSLTAAERFGVIEHHAIWRTPTMLYEDALYSFAVAAAFASAMYLAVYFAGSIVQRLRARDAELISTTTSLEQGTLELQEAYEKIRALEARKSDFLRLAAHQLRAPLSAIRSLLDVVLDGFASDPARKSDMLQRAHDRADLMLAMVGDLLALSRQRDAADERAAAPERVDVPAVIAEAEALSRPRAEAKGLVLSAAPARGDCTALAGPDDVRQVVTNLIDNAINYTPTGGAVTCAVERQGATVAIIVSDTGIGIAEEDQERLFTEFFRAPNAKRLVSYGTGLGLSIARTAVVRWGGRITVKSALGTGTTFRVELPAA